MLVWEVDELESLGLPPKEADIVIFSVKHYLPVLWIVGNPKAFQNKDVPTADSFAQLNLARSMSLSETFAICMNADSHSRDTWERSVDDPKVRVYMLDFIYKIARQHHNLFENSYASFQLRYKPHRVLHEMYCQIKEEFPPMHSFNQRLEEQYAIQCERVKRHNEGLEQQAN